jgi:DNA helicase II / ATP-dependent DNA helicase PcrA
MNPKILNKQQQKAIKHDKGPLLIIAGAGTGKTTVVTERIKYLISSGRAKPAEILALTFTQKAALEMEERVDKILPMGYFQMWISTFHSFCDQILRQEALHIGLDPHFILHTEAESLLFLRKNLFDFQLDYFRPAGNPFKFLNGMLTHFNRLKDEDIASKEYLKYAKGLKEQLKKLNNHKNLGKSNITKEEINKTTELAQAFLRYEKLKAKQGIMDFSDLIANTLKLFRQRKNILKQYQDKFKYILVDEYQDTNIAQNQLTTILAGKNPNLTVVGDDDQSIYKFRGSSVSNLIQFKKTYPKTKIITLTQNYRSTQEILNRAYDLIQKNNPDRLEIKEKIVKKLIAVNKTKGEKIKFFLADRVEQEADMIAQEIKKLTARKKNNLNKFDYKDIAILVRANNHALPFVQIFLRQGIPFQFLGPGRLLRQEETLDLIAYLKVLYNFEDNVAFFRILSLPIFKLSARDIAALRVYGKKNNLSFFESAEFIEKIRVSQKSREQINKIVKMIHKHLKLIPKESAGQILYYFLENTGLLQKMADFKTEKEEQKALNIARFFDKLKTYEAENEDAGVEAVVDWLNLKLEMGESPLAADTDWTEENKVNILTVHSAKGLEFKTVFLPNLVSQRFPTINRKDQIPIPDELIKEILPEGNSHEQEERRLFYVGMTRARFRLYFTAAKYYGEAKRLKKISPFVLESLGEQLDQVKVEPEKNQLTIFDFKSSEKFKNLSSKLKAHKINVISYSQIETFKRCPLQYKYNYIIKIPVPISSAASFGITIHNALKDFYQLVLQGKTANQREMIRILKSAWINQGYSSKQHEKKMYSRAKEFLLQFLKKGYNKKDKPIALEQDFRIKIKKELNLVGRFDRVDQLNNGKIELIDYKTGKVATQKDVDKNMQMTIYALASSNKGFYNLDSQKIKLSFYFLQTHEKISTLRTKEQINKAIENIIKIKKEIEESDFFPKPGLYCDFCDFKLICPAWQ